MIFKFFEILCNKFNLLKKIIKETAVERKREILEYVTLLKIFFYVHKDTITLTLCGQNLQLYIVHLRTDKTDKNSSKCMYFPESRWLM